MSPLGNSMVQYSEAFAAIGRFIANKGLKDVCVLEFEKGVIITGSRLYESGESYRRRTETYVLSDQELSRLVRGR